MKMQKLLLGSMIFVLFAVVILFFLFKSEDDDPIKIALIDTGVSTRAISSKHLLQGENFILPNENTEDKLGHGTAIASIIVGSEVAEIEAFCSTAQIIPLIYATKDDEGNRIQGDTDMVADIILKAIDIYESDIIVLSSGTTKTTPSLANSIAYAEQQGVIIVSSIGNYHEQNAEAIYYPAAYDTVIAVGASSLDGTVAPFSNRGETLDIIAPGTNLRVAGMSGGDIYVNGTSYATAYVAAACANLLQENKKQIPKQIRESLYQTAIDVGEKGYDHESGWGLLRTN